MDLPINYVGARTQHVSPHSVGKNKRSHKFGKVRLSDRRHIYYKSGTMHRNNSRCISNTTHSSDESADDERGTQSSQNKQKKQSELLSFSARDSDNEQSSSSLVPNITERKNKSKAASHRNAKNEDSKSSSSDMFEDSQPKTIRDKVKLTISKEQSFIFKSNVTQVLNEFKYQWWQFKSKLNEIKCLKLQNDVKSLETANNISLEVTNIAEKFQLDLEDQCKKLKQFHQSWSRKCLPSDEASDSDDNISNDDDIADDDIAHRGVDSEKEDEQKKKTILEKDSDKSSKEEPSRVSKSNEGVNKEPITLDVDINVIFSETEETSRPDVVRTASYSPKATTVELHEPEKSILVNNDSTSSTLEDGNKKASRKDSSITGLSNDTHNTIQHNETMANNTTVSSSSKITSDDNISMIYLKEKSKRDKLEIKSKLSGSINSGSKDKAVKSNMNEKSVLDESSGPMDCIVENNNSTSSTLEDGNKKASQKDSSITGLSNDTHNTIQHNKTMANNTTVSSSSITSDDNISMIYLKEKSKRDKLEIKSKLSGSINSGSKDKAVKSNMNEKSVLDESSGPMDCIVENNNSTSSTLEDGNKKASQKDSSITGLSNDTHNTIQHNKTMANNTTVSSSSITSDDNISMIYLKEKSKRDKLEIKSKLSGSINSGSKDKAVKSNMNEKSVLDESSGPMDCIVENNNSTSSTLEDGNKKASQKDSSITGLSNDTHNTIQHNKTMANNTTVSSSSKITSDDNISMIYLKEKSKRDKLEIKSKLSGSINSGSKDKAVKSNMNEKSVLDESSGPMDCIVEKLFRDADGSDSVEKSKGTIEIRIENISDTGKIAKTSLVDTFVSEIEGPKETMESSDDEQSKIKKRKLNSDKGLQKEDNSDEEDDKDSSKSKWRQNKMLTMKFSHSETEIEKEREKMSEKRNNKASDEKEDETSKDECVIKRRGSRKRVLLSDSDAKESKSSSDSESSDNSGTSEGEKKKKRIKRRRIKQMDSDSDSQESDGSDNGKGDNLNSSQSRMQVEKKEEEIPKFIAEREKLLKKLAAEETLKELVLDFNSETKQPLVTVHKEIVKHLKPHQAEGIRFMWNSCFESLERLKTSQGSGCIIAHSMGLGKTLQVIGLVQTLLMHEEIGIQTVMIVCPLSIVLNWVKEIKKWLKDTGDANDIKVYELTKIKANDKRMYKLQSWKRTGGMLIIGYDLFKQLTNVNRKMRKIMKKNVEKSIEIKQILNCLLDPGPDLVICDEGHLLKNEGTTLRKCMNTIKTCRRIVLTGTPLENNLDEYYWMVQFVKPSLLGTYHDFKDRFVDPINHGQYKDSTPYEVMRMKKRVHILHQKLIGCVQRFGYSVLTPFLPPKQEYVIFVSLSHVQIKLYQYCLDHSRDRGRGFISIFHVLQRICSHPLALQYHEEKWEKRNERSKEGFINDDSEHETSGTSSSDREGELEGRKNHKRRVSEMLKYYHINRYYEEEPQSEEENHSSESWWERLVSPEHLEDMRLSGKLMLLFGILKECQKVKDKLLVFSQSLYTLRFIESFLKKNESVSSNSESASNLCGHTGNWTFGKDYFRLDGRTSPQNRNNWCKKFNKPTNTRARLFLISTKAGGLGINLTAANRVIIFDTSWNPSHDLQSIFRIYRFGQTKSCYIYRFLAAGTMEEKIYSRQVVKLSLSHRVVDEEQIGRHYTYTDLQLLRETLFQFKPNLTGKKPTLNLPKDRLLANVFEEYKDYVENYHDHDSLLENKTEEELDSDEKELAWLEYEKEKKEKFDRSKFSELIDTSE